MLASTVIAKRIGIGHSGKLASSSVSVTETFAVRHTIVLG